MTTFNETNHPALHYQDMLADARRMRLYRAAIEGAVRPGDRVADLGTGLGVLAIMAAQAGAARVYAVEVRPEVIPLAQRVIAANGVADRVVLCQGDARTLELPEPVDLIVNELIGDFGTDENIVESVGAFAARHLRPAGRILPERLTTWLVPVEYGDEFHGVYRRGFHGLDLSPALELPAAPAAVMFGLRQVPKQLAAPCIVEDIRFARDLPPRVHRIELDFEITAAGRLQGFVGYFEAVLSGDLSLRNYPCYPGCHWVNWHWPLTPPIQVAQGQRIEAVLEARANMVAAGWFLDWTLR